MQPSYKHYLKIIKNTCTGHEGPVTIPSEELADLARLAEEIGRASCRERV